MWALQKWWCSLPYSFSLCFPCDVCNFISPWKIPVFSPWCVSTVWIGAKDSVASIRKAMQPSPKNQQGDNEAGTEKQSTEMFCVIYYQYTDRYVITGENLLWITVRSRWSPEKLGAFISHFMCVWRIWASKLPLLTSGFWASTPGKENMSLWLLLLLMGFRQRAFCGQDFILWLVTIWKPQAQPNTFLYPGEIPQVSANETGFLCSD